MTKDGFNHVENSGVSQRDLNRGFSDGMAKPSDTGSEFPSNDGELIGAGITNQQPMEGFLGRAKGWER